MRRGTRRLPPAAFRAVAIPCTVFHQPCRLGGDPVCGRTRLNACNSRITPRRGSCLRVVQGFHRVPRRSAGPHVAWAETRTRSLLLVLQIARSRAIFYFLLIILSPPVVWMGLSCCDARTGAYSLTGGAGAERVVVLHLGQLAQRSVVCRCLQGLHPRHH